MSNNGDCNFEPTKHESDSSPRRDGSSKAHSSASTNTTLINFDGTDTPPHPSPTNKPANQKHTIFILDQRRHSQQNDRTESRWNSPSSYDVTSLDYTDKLFPASGSSSTGFQSLAQALAKAGYFGRIGLKEFIRRESVKVGKELVLAELWVDLQENSFGVKYPQTMILQVQDL
ncbi:hypothetical protein BJ508DRAFT_348827 [Ascobolus immersus RN42]|uniref:Uncharacterized protein n=1 Tax=Ascobolus immersus RN42 TaxID=1160509 RepID=A0A3N4IB95_ASCIM|nr:hypothetical protein BJ508DRAFT_348827 [Ascobolus immersus RN42]